MFAKKVLAAMAAVLAATAGSIVQAAQITEFDASVNTNMAVYWVSEI